MKRLLIFLFQLSLLPALAGAADLGPTLHPRAQALPFTHQGPFVTTADDGVLCVDAQNAWQSRDEGMTWTSTPVFGDATKFKISNERALLRTRDGVVIAAWMNLNERSSPKGWGWGREGVAWQDFVLPTYVCRSLDEGKTWEDPILLNKPWCGCIHSMIETRSGRIVLVGQEIIAEWRHATVMFVSDDKGRTWQRSKVLDYGIGRHDHAGSIEGTVVERKDGSLYLLLRTESGWLYEATSKDGGLVWQDLQQSQIKSVTCCPQMGRLADGRIALLWNHPPRHRPESGTSREELSIAFSSDECATWSEPVVVAGSYSPKGRVSYPYLYERKPGELWITTMQGGLRMKIHAADLTQAQIPIFKAAAPPPLDLGGQHASTPDARGYFVNGAVTLADGTIESYFRRGTADGVSIFRIRSADDARTWSEPEAIVHLPNEKWGGPVPLLDRDGEVHLVIAKGRGAGSKPNVDRFIDLHHLRSTAGRTRWTEPRRIYEGYCGALQGVFQLESGRILVPFADWLPGIPLGPPTGPEVTTCVYSDDAGRSWQRSPAKLTAPCHEGTNTPGYGACEPSLIELRDGRVWMLIRTQDGFLYESFSPDGADWSEAKRSRFASSNSPAFPIRLHDGRIVVFWNNCVTPPRVGTDGVYGGRDALHAALSADEGKTWSGFREVYRDPTRNGSPPKAGDRGTAYPHATVTKDGKILLISGQGADRRRRFLIDPDWLMEKSRVEHFANLEAWHLFKGFGKPVRFWRDRVQGPELITHPDKSGAKALRIRRPDERDADGAVWNFPAGKRGTLTVRLRVEKDFGGAQISLTDRMFEPSDDAGEKLAAFALKLDGAAPFQAGAWRTVELAWDTSQAACSVRVDGQAAPTLKAAHAAPNGLSYLRLRSTASVVDPAGILIESVKVEVE